VGMGMNLEFLVPGVQHAEEAELGAEMLLPLLFNLNVQTQNPGRTCIRHVISPTRYPTLTRQARLQGPVVAKLKISPDGSVADVTVQAEDPVLRAHPMLQSETQELVRTWTFECQSCAPGVAFEHGIKFNYRLEGADGQ
jgi:TonB family protein